MERLGSSKGNCCRSVIGVRMTYSFNCYVEYYFAEYTCPCKLLTLFVSVPNCCKLLFILLENYWDNFLFKFVYFFWCGFPLDAEGFLFWTDLSLDQMEWLRVSATKSTVPKDLCAYSQGRSSIPPKMALMNRLFEKWFC